MFSERNRNIFSEFFRVIETLVKVWENSKRLWKHSHTACVPTAFLVLPNVRSCFYLVLETPVKVWENSKKLWKHSPAARVSTAFLVLPNFHSCSYLTNRFHVAVRLFSNRSQMTSKCGKNKKLAHEA